MHRLLDELGRDPAEFANGPGIEEVTVAERSSSPGELKVVLTARPPQRRPCRRPLPRGRAAHGRRDGRGARRPLRADALAGAVNFLSTGTNDLSQYTYAADRQVGELAELLDPWQPAVLALIAACGEARRRTGWPVGVCGEAGRPRTGAARARALVRDDPPVR